MDAAREPVAERIASGLAEAGWAQQQGFLSIELVDSLRARIECLTLDGVLRPAAVGAGAERRVRSEVRGDRLAWLDAATPVEQQLLAQLDALRLDLNRTLTLGLFDLECHYASYAPGARYVRHLDRSARGAERAISVVLYVNSAWHADDGGALVLYPDGAPVRVLPTGGTLVAFLSERIEHEVEPARRERLSIAGWFRRRTHVAS